MEELSENLLNSYISGKYVTGNKFTNKSLSLSSIKTIIGIINRALKYAYKRAYIDKRIQIDIVIKPNNKKKIECLSKDEQSKLEKYILENKKIYNYGVIISMYTGLRIGELVSLKWENIDFKHKVIVINSTTYRTSINHKSVVIKDSAKTESSNREIPLVKEVILLLKELKSYQKNKSEYVISRKTGKQIEVRSYQDSFTRLLKKLDIKHYDFHSLRHTFATRSLEVGVDIKTLSEILGHSNPTVTLNTYVHSNMDLKRNALNKLVKKFSLMSEV